MLHNTGPYGPNEAPINMGAPLNVTQLNVPMLPHNLNNLGKMPQQPPHPAPGGYNLGNFPPYGYQPSNPSPQMPPFPNYHSNVFHSSFMTQSPSAMIDTGWQNGMLPMSLNIPNEQASNAINFPTLDKPSISEYKNIDMTQKIPLNIPQIQTKAYHKQVPLLNDQIHDNFHQQPSYNINTKQNVENNLDSNIKQTDILEHDVTRRKTLENTIKMIENILVNTTKNRETENRDNDMKITEQIQNSPKDMVLKQNSMTDSQTISDNEDSESEEDIKPIIGEEHEMPRISVKVEPLLMEGDPLSMEMDVVFLQDPNGVSRDDVEDCNVVDGDTSVMDAMEAVKNGTNPTRPNAHYECPHCRLLVRHPKRFLIHTKWHMFGLKRSKRLEIARVKSERRIQLRMARSNLNPTSLTAEDIEKGNAFPCKDCNQIFGTKGSLKNHRQRVHPTRSRECKICKKTVLGWMALRAHVASHTDDSGYQCADCPKRFKYAHSLAKHRDTHLEKTHGCDQCSKMFGSQALLKMHMKTHERALRGATFRCTYCGKGFYEAWNLQVHERTHRNERPFLCEICNTAFGTNSSLKRHIKVSHSASKPHECSTCHRCFMSAVILERHERRAHGDPEDFKFVCKLCTCRYMTSKDLQKHIYKVHPKGKRKIKEESDSE